MKLKNHTFCIPLIFNRFKTFIIITSKNIKSYIKNFEKIKNNQKELKKAAQRLIDGWKNGAGLNDLELTDLISVKDLEQLALALENSNSDKIN